MRDIKFRAIVAIDGGEIKKGEYVYGYYTCLPNPNYATIHTINSKGEKTAYIVDPETVGQYTGLTDKNGVEVYEWDIVKGLVYDSDEYNTKGEVRFYNSQWQVFDCIDCPNLGTLTSFTLEVIGTSTRTKT